MRKPMQARDRSQFRPSAIAEESQCIGGFARLPALIRQLAADPAVALSAAGLATDALDDSERRISYLALGRLMCKSVELTQCAHFGLLAGRMWHLSDLGLVGELMRHSPTVGEALRKLVLCQHLNSEAAVAFIREQASVVDLGCAVYGSSVTGIEQFCDAYLAAGVNFLRELCGPGWKPTEVFLPYAMPRDCLQYRLFFKVQPHFNAEFCALRFSASWMTKAVDGAEPARLRAAEQEATTVGQPSLIQQVSRALRILLLSGRSSGDDVANMLSMHRRTLNRRLKAQGTTFQMVLDRIRFDVASQLLGGSDISLDEVAAVLGYAGVSPFMRSFRRWTNTTPGRYRHASRQAKFSGDTLQFRPPFTGDNDRRLTAPSG